MKTVKVDQETEELRKAPTGPDPQDALLELMAEPGVKRAHIPMLAEEFVVPVPLERKKHYAIIVLRVATDVIAYLCAARFAYWLRFENLAVVTRFPPEAALSLGDAMFALVIAMPVLISFLKICGLYETRVRVRTLDRFPRIVAAVNGFIITLLVAMFLLDASGSYRGYTIFFWFTCILFLATGRILLQSWYSVMGKIDVVERNTLLVGAGQVGKALALKLVQHPEFGLRPIGFIDDHPLIERFSEPEIEDLRVLGGLKEISSVIEERNVEKVIVGFSRDSHESMLELVTLCNNAGVECSVLPRLFEVITDDVLVSDVGGISMVPVSKKSFSVSSNAIKTVEDYAVALLGLAVFWPVLVAVAIAIKLDSPGPVFYRQTRIGRHGRPFQFIKFRSMVVGADMVRDDLESERGDDLLFKISDDPRITRVGRWIRKFSIDELPQLFNVLKGQMSIVGPRPGLPEEVEKYKGWQRLRLNAKPGITGMWQVNGRSDLPFDEMVKYDLYYIECWSIWLDIKTILRTFIAVLHGRGAY